MLVRNTYLDRSRGKSLVWLSFHRALALNMFHEVLLPLIKDVESVLDGFVSGRELLIESFVFGREVLEHSKDSFHWFGGLLLCF